MAPGTAGVADWELKTLVIFTVPCTFTRAEALQLLDPSAQSPLPGVTVATLTALATVPEGVDVMV